MATRAPRASIEAEVLAHPTVVDFETATDIPPRLEPSEKYEHGIQVVPETTNEKIGELSEDAIQDLYRPLPMNLGLPEEEHILRIRAIFVGIILGALINASNLYLGLKTGFTFSASMFGAIFGYGICKAMSKFEQVPIIGGFFGPQENSIIQAAATGSGAMGTIFVSGIPAMYQLGLLNTDYPKGDFGAIVTLTLCCATFGLCFVTPLRKFFIVQVGRELRLVFPTATATALVIRNMHAGVTGGINAIKRLWALVYSFCFALILRVASSYCLGILWDWHIFTWVHIWSGYTSKAMHLESWGWYIQLTPAFFGSGLLIGLNSALSMLLGSVLAWGFIGPVLVRTGECVGVNVVDEDDPDFDKWQDFMSYTSLSGLDGQSTPSPRYWLLWPGVMMMLCASMVELFIQYKVIWYALKVMTRESFISLNTALQKHGKSVPWLAKGADGEVKRAEDLVEDPAPPNQQVPGWLWGLGLIGAIVLGIVICDRLWDVHPGYSILGLLLSFVFSFLAIHVGGVTDTTPLSAAAKASQLVMGAATSSSGYSVAKNQKINLVSGVLASGGASVASDLTADFRTGFLIGTPPRKQWTAQAIGQVVAVFLAPGMYLVFAQAYPCIVKPEKGGHCQFGAPSVAAWAAVARAVTNPNGISISKSSGIFAIIMGVVCIVQAIFRHFYLVGEREKYRNWLPNWGAVALAFIIPSPVFTNAGVVGAVLGAIWKHKYPEHWEIYAYSIAAGFIAGEGLGGLLNAILTIAGVDGDKYGSTIACPAGYCE